MTWLIVQICSAQFINFTSTRELGFNGGFDNSLCIVNQITDSWTSPFILTYSSWISWTHFVCVSKCGWRNPKYPQLAIHGWQCYCMGQYRNSGILLCLCTEHNTFFYQLWYIWIVFYQYLWTYIWAMIQEYYCFYSKKA